MLRIVIFSVLLFLSAAVFVETAAQEKQYISDEIMVGVNVTDNFEKDVQHVEEMNTRCGTEIKKSVTYGDTTMNIYHMLLKINNGRTAEDTILCWKQSPQINFAQPNFILHPYR